MIGRRGFLKAAGAGLVAVAAGRLPQHRDYRWKRTVTDKVCVMLELTPELMAEGLEVVQQVVDRAVKAEVDFCLAERFVRVDSIERLPDRWNIHASFLDARAKMRATFRVTGIERPGWVGRLIQPSVRRRDRRKAYAAWKRSQTHETA